MRNSKKNMLRNRTIHMEEDNIIKRWKEYFKYLLKEIGKAIETKSKRFMLTDKERGKTLKRN